MQQRIPRQDSRGPGRTSTNENEEGSFGIFLFN